MDVEQIETMYGAFLCWKDDLVARQLKLFSAHTRNEIAMLSSVVAPGDCVIDVGAHIGTYAIPFARFTAPHGKVFAFEANPGNFSLLVRNVEINRLQDSVETIHAVVTDVDSAFEMRLPTGANSGMYYFVPASTAGHGVARAHLDSWLAKRSDQFRIALIKIDVEGAELRILRSCMRTVRAQLPVLYIEICPSSLARFQTSTDDIEQFLANLGYDFFRNIGKRNSSNDEYRIARIASLAEGGPFFDVLAVHPTSKSYPAVSHALTAG